MKTVSCNSSIVPIQNGSCAPIYIGCNSPRPRISGIQGGGAFDNKVFGFTGRPSNGHSSFVTLEDVSSDWHAKPYLDLDAYYAHAVGKTVIGAIYPDNRRGQMGYLELVFHWNTGQPRP